MTTADSDKSKTECSPFDGGVDLFITVDTVLSSISLFITFLAIYCIIFHSSSSMVTYRWYLLYHQAVTSVGDIYLGIFHRPFIYFPFTIFDFFGIFAKYGLVSSHMLVVIAVIVIWFSVAAATHLFHYRYLVAKGLDFSRSDKAFIGFVYTTPFIPAVTLFVIGPDTGRVVEKLAEKYTCITQDITHSPALLGYDITHFICIFLPAMVAEAAFLFLLIAVYVYKTLYAIMTSVVSEKTRKMQKKFLFALLNQVLAPLTLMIIPTIGAIFIIVQDVFGFAAVGNICIAVMAIHGAVGGVVLILVTPSYRRAVLRCNRALTTPVTSLQQTSTINSVPQ